jgi:uncharacterized Tic20 family protein
MNIADDLQKLQQLYQSGAIDEHEFALAKAKLLDVPIGTDPELGASYEEAWFAADSREISARQWALFLHLSLLIPVIGLFVPIVVWQLKKDVLPGIDAHGRNAANWIISKIIYFVVSLVLMIVIIGIPMILALGVVSIVFPIIAAIKANGGEAWRYPLAISFFR